MIYLVLCILIVVTLLRVEASALPAGTNNTIAKEIASMMKHIKALELRLNETELRLNKTELRLNKTEFLLAEKIALLEV